MRSEQLNIPVLLFFSFLLIFVNGCASPNTTYVRMKDIKGDIELTEKTPLMKASQFGDLEKIREFVKRGAEVNAKNQAIDLMTPLHYAAGNGHIEIAKLLLENEADVNAITDILWTPLHYAALNGSTDLTSLLIKNDADLNARDAELLTPLYYAVFNKHHTLARHLINAGAKVYENTENGEYSHTTAKCYKMIAEYYAAGKKDKDKIIENYELAAKHFDTASEQFMEQSYSALTKEVIVVGALVLANAASSAAASYQANAQAKQHALIDAMRSSNGVGKGHGFAEYYIFWDCPARQKFGSEREYYSDLSKKSRQDSVACLSIVETYKKMQ